MNRHTTYNSIDLLLIRIKLIGLLVEFAVDIETVIFMSIVPIQECISWTQNRYIGS